MTLEQILQYVGPGPLAGIIAVAWFFYPVYKRHVKGLEQMVILKRCDIRLQKALLEFLKKEGHDVKIPDLIEEI